jgi:hypothetical protein
MNCIVTITLRADDAEPLLRKAAYEAAKFGSWCDYITRRTYNPPSNPSTARAGWQESFLRAKRTVEGFGIQYEMVSEEETLSVHIPDKVLKSHLTTIAGMTFRHIDKSVLDPKRMMPSYRGEVHSQACHAAADRVVRAWRQSLERAHSEKGVRGEQGERGERGHLCDPGRYMTQDEVAASRTLIARTLIGGRRHKSEPGSAVGRAQDKASPDASP